MYFSHVHVFNIFDFQKLIDAINFIQRGKKGSENRSEVCPCEPQYIYQLSVVNTTPKTAFMIDILKCKIIDIVDIFLNLQKCNAI